MTLKKIFLAFAVALFSTISINGQTAGESPVAASEAVVTASKARFTVLTPRLIRMEWAEDGKFEDRATLGIVNRHLDVPEFKTVRTGKKVTIVTENLKLTYTGQEKFNAGNLKVEFEMADPGSRKGVRKVTWHPGADDSGNLLGTTRTLDGCDGIRTKEPYDPGVISRDGWAIVDESERLVMSESGDTWGSWVENKEDKEYCDLYIFAYGHDYKAAIKDFTRIAGNIPLPPKYAFGYWWSRYWQYSDFEFVELAKDMRSMNIPIDIMVIDMDWHETWTLCKKNAPKDEVGQRIGWTGYTWQEQLFPSPENFLEEIHRLGMKTSLNLHPASGIQPYEKPYDDFVKDFTDRSPEYAAEDFIDDKGNKKPVPFMIEDKDWTDAYFNSVIHPIERQGVDFWWLDWQQWKFSKNMPALNNTFWLNRTFFDDKVRAGREKGLKADRPMIYHRWGGLGSHRYQIGFSGDTYDEWQVLSYLPYFTATASNVCYGYWGHDIGGHMQKKGHPTDPEMYTRWLQFGVFTPIFKTHSTKSIYLERRIWAYPEYFTPMRDAIRLRYTLSPYIYTAARAAYDTGISMCRPMYYDYPEEDNAYTWKQQYMFGDNILATAAGAPADSITGLSEVSIWFPEGDDWYDMATGAMHKGGTTDTLYYTINENPYFVKAGAIIPMASETINSLQEKSNEFCVFVAPGYGHRSATLYEDDGTSQEYVQKYAETLLEKNASPEETEIRIHPRKGDYEGAPADRKASICLESVLPPVSVTVNGREIPYSRFAEEGEWTYDGKSLSVKIFLPETSAGEDIVVKCINDTSYAPDAIYGKKGIISRMARITPEVKLVYGRHVDAYRLLPIPFLKVAQCSSYITENPAETGRYLESVDIEAMNAAFDALETMPSEFKRKIGAQSSRF